MLIINAIVSFIVVVQLYFVVKKYFGGVGLIKSAPPIIVR